MTTDSVACPAGIEKLSKAYLMGTLPRQQAIAFEDHYVACDECATVLYRIVEYVDAMREAAKKMRPAPATQQKQLRV